MVTLLDYGPYQKSGTEYSEFFYPVRLSLRQVKEPRGEGYGRKAGPFNAFFYSAAFLAAPLCEFDYRRFVSSG